MSRGELVEIGAGFRLPDLMESTGASLREVGTTNRTHLHDYAEPSGPTPAAFSRSTRATSEWMASPPPCRYTNLAPLPRRTGLPLVADLGSGLLAPDPLLPEEPDVATALAGGADVVIASGDKLLGGPQAGLLLGTPRYLPAGHAPAGPGRPRRQTGPRRARGHAQGGEPPVAAGAPCNLSAIAAPD